MQAPSSVQPARTADDLNRYRGYLKSIAIVNLGCRLQAKLDASDVVQLTMMDAYRDLAKFQGEDEAQFKAWLRTILANNLFGIYRHYDADRRDVGREVGDFRHQLDNSSMCLDKYLAADQTSPSQYAQRNELYEKLANALTQLPEEQRVAVIRKHFEGWKLAAIAEDMGKSVEAVGGLLKRGLKELNRLMKMKD